MAFIEIKNMHVRDPRVEFTLGFDPGTVPATTTSFPVTLDNNRPFQVFITVQDLDDIGGPLGVTIANNGSTTVTPNNTRRDFSIRWDYNDINYQVGKQCNVTVTIKQGNNQSAVQSFLHVPEEV